MQLLPTFIYSVIHFSLYIYLFIYSFIHSFISTYFRSIHSSISVSPTAALLLTVTDKGTGRLFFLNRSNETSLFLSFENTFALAYISDRLHKDKADKRHLGHLRDACLALHGAQCWTFSGCFHSPSALWLIFSKAAHRPNVLDMEVTDLTHTSRSLTPSLHRPVNILSLKVNTKACKPPFFLLLLHFRDHYKPAFKNAHFDVKTPTCW